MHDRSSYLDPTGSPPSLLFRHELVDRRDDLQGGGIDSDSDELGPFARRTFDVHQRTRLDSIFRHVHRNDPWPHVEIQRSGPTSTLKAS